MWKGGWIDARVSLEEAFSWRGERWIGVGDSVFRKCKRTVEVLARGEGNGLMSWISGRMLGIRKPSP